MGRKPQPSTKEDISRVTIVKGFAIAAVVMLHILSSLPGKVFTQFPMAWWFVALDQFGRFSVPVFIGLSGYALARKYWDNIDLIEFFQRRFIKLLPLYLLWTVGLRLLFIMIPPWYTTATPLPWWQVILLGSGDYHLYFVPLILQFYLLFPVLRWGIQRWPVLLLVTSLAVQTAAIHFYGSIPQTEGWLWLRSDQAQYSLFVSWIGYFVSGMWLARLRETNHFPAQKWVQFGGMLWILGWLGLSYSASAAIQNGLDPLYALKFTRLLVVPFGVLSIFLATAVPWEKVLQPLSVKNFWLKMGKWSFLIYLSHTLVLRLIFGYDIPGITALSLILAVLWLVGGVAISIWLEKPTKRS